MGSVVNVFNSGASDLLQVMLDTSLDIVDSTGKPKPAGTRLSGHLVWIPFVEEIVPNVDMNRKEMQITPPKGLLELNLRFDERSKKERRQLVRHTLFFTLHICYFLLTKPPFPKSQNTEIWCFLHYSPCHQASCSILFERITKSKSHQLELWLQLMCWRLSGLYFCRLIVL